MKELKSILLKWLENSNKAITCNEQGIGITFYNEDARIKSKVLIQVLKQVKYQKLFRLTLFLAKHQQMTMNLKSYLKKK